MVEQGTHKPLVVGSNPSLATFCGTLPQPVALAVLARGRFVFLNTNLLPMW